MLGAVLSHMRVKDPIGKIMPATVLMILALVLAVVHFSAVTELL